jgi:hypothetical protein
MRANQLLLLPAIHMETIMNFQAPNQQWPNNGVPIMASPTSASNFARPAIQPYTKAISSALCTDLQQTANTNVLRSYLYTIAQQSQFSNQTFIAMIQMACMLTEYLMACQRMPPDQAVIQGAMYTNRYYAASMVTAPDLQGRIDAATYQDANNTLNTINQLRQAAMAYIQSAPVVSPQQMMMGTTSMVDPRFGNPMMGGQMMPNQMMGMNQFAGAMPVGNMMVNTATVASNPAGFQMPAPTNTTQLNPMLAASQTPVKVTEGSLQKEQLQKEQQMNSNLPVFCDVPKQPINKVVAEVGTVSKPNPLAGMLSELPIAKMGTSVVLGTVSTVAPIPDNSSGIILYTDEAFDENKQYFGFGVHPAIFNPYTDIGYVDINNKCYGIAKSEVDNVDYVAHRNYHLLKPKGVKKDETDNNLFLESIQRAAVVTDIKATLERIEKDRNEIHIKDDEAIQYAMSESIHLGTVPVMTGDYHSSAYAAAEENNIILDMDSSVVRMNVVTPSDWCLDESHANFIKTIKDAGRWSDIVNEMHAARKRLPLYIWHDIDTYMLRLFNEINMIELDSGIYIDDSFTASVIDAGKAITSNIGKENANLYIVKALQVFKDRIVFDNCSSFDEGIPADSKKMHLTVYEDVTLLPILSDEVTLACPSDVGCIDRYSTPELFGLVDLTFKSRPKGCRWVKFITVDKGIMYVYKSVTADEYLIATKVLFD